MMIWQFGKEMREGRSLLGSWCTFASFASVEVMTKLGFDFLILDMQHCEITQGHFPALLGRSARADQFPWYARQRTTITSSTGCLIRVSVQFSYRWSTPLRKPGAQSTPRSSRRWKAQFWSVSGRDLQF